MSYNWLRSGLNENTTPITREDLRKLEYYADSLFSKVGIDIEFTRHFLDRVNDERNRKQITIGELARLFKETYERYGKPIARLGPDAQGVIQDMITDVNMPFVLDWDASNQELDLIAKSVMRKKGFRTTNPSFKLENAKLDELFTDAYSWTSQKSENEIAYNFETDTGRDVVVGFEELEPGEYEVAFAVDGEFDVTGKGDQFKIFGTVLQILDDFVQKHRPKQIGFDAVDGDSRARLYGRLAKKMADEWGWDLKTDTAHGATVYWVRRPGIREALLESRVLRELFSDTYEYNLNFKARSFDAKFKAKGGLIEVDGAYEERDDSLYVLFELVTPDGKRTFSKSGTGDQFRIFATVLEIIKRGVEHFDATTLHFSSEGGSRDKLYVRMAKKFAAETGWKFARWMGGTFFLFDPERATPKSGWVIQESQLNELFSDSYPLEKEEQSQGARIFYRFETESGTPYVVVFGRSPGGQVFLDFGAGDSWSTAITGTGDAFKVFSTVIEAIKQFDQEYKPKMYMFSARKPSRVKLYNRLARQFEKFGFEVTSNQNKGSTYYDVTRKSDDVQESLNESVVAYHGTGMDFDEFSDEYAIGTVTWFTDNKDLIRQGEVGASTKGFLITAELDIDNPAGWDEYDKYGIDELIALGYDGLKLEDEDQTTWVTFSDKQIKILDKERLSVKEGVGRITKQNMTVDVGADEVTKQAKKWGFKVDRDGRPPTLGVGTKSAKSKIQNRLHEQFRKSLLESEEMEHGTYSALYMTEECARKLTEWCDANGIEHQPPEEMHCTLIYSKTPVPELKEFDGKPVKCRAKIKEWKKLGDALVFELDFPEAVRLNELMMNAGATSDFPSYICHTTVNPQYESDELPTALPEFDLEYDRTVVTGVDPDRSTVKEQVITELFDNPYDVEIREYSHKVNYIFTTDSGDKMTIMITRSDNQSTVEFRSDSTFYDPTNKREPIRVFSTVIQAIKHFDKKYHPNVYVFSADIPSRRKLYDRLAKNMASMGFYLDIKDDFEREYVLTRKSSVDYKVIDPGLTPFRAGQYITQKEYDQWLKDKSYGEVEKLNESQQLNELFNRPYEFTDVRHTDYRSFYFFHDGERKYNITITDNDDQGVILSFGAMDDEGGWSAKPTGSSPDPVRVFSTVIRAMKSYQMKFEPKKWSFGGEGASRIKLYDRLARVMEKQGWEVRRVPVRSDSVEWWLTKKDTNESQLNELYAPSMIQAYGRQMSKKEIHDKFSHEVHYEHPGIGFKIVFSDISTTDEEVLVYDIAMLAHNQADEFELTGKGRETASRQFGVVLAAIQDFVQNYHPDEVVAPGYTVRQNKFYLKAIPVLNKILTKYRAVNDQNALRIQRNYRVKEQINELFQPEKYIKDLEVVQQDEFEVILNHPKADFDIRFVEGSAGWDVELLAKSNVGFRTAGDFGYRATGRGGYTASTQYAVAIAAIQWFLKKYDVDKLTFRGWDQKQQNLYQAIAGKVKMPGYEVGTLGKNIVIKKADLEEDMKSNPAHMSKTTRHKMARDFNPGDVLASVPTPDVMTIAFKHGVSPRKIRAELERGIEIEREHTTDEQAAREIALDHLAELPDYYTRLDKMEKGADNVLQDEREGESKTLPRY